MATFQTASLLNIIEQGQKMESVFVNILLETAMKLSSITDANILVVVDTAHGRKWAGRRGLKDEFVEGRLRLGTKDEEVTGAEGLNGGTGVDAAQFGQELLMGDLGIAASTNPSDHPDAGSTNKHSATPRAASRAPSSSTPINYSYSFKPTSVEAPLSIKTSPMPNADSPHEDPASSSATSASLESAFKDATGFPPGSTKLVGSQKRKRRASQTSMQEKKIRAGSAEADIKKEPGNAGSHAFLKGLEAAEESASTAMGIEDSAKQFLDQVAKKYASSSVDREGSIDRDASQPRPREMSPPNSDAEVAQFYHDGQNNNVFKTSLEKPPGEKAASLPSDVKTSEEARGRPAFSPNDSVGGEGEDLTASSSSQALDIASPLVAGGNFFQEQIRQMLRAKMTVEQISFHLKIPPSIVTYWIQLIGGLPPTPTVKSHSPLDQSLDKSGAGKALAIYNNNNNNMGGGMMGEDFSASMVPAKTTPGRRSGKLDKQSLKNLIDSNKSIREIADILGVHPTTVYRAMKAYDLSLPGHNNNNTTAPNVNKVNVSGAGKPHSMALSPYADPEQPHQQPQGREGEANTSPAAATAAPTGQRVRVKRDRMQILKNLIMSGATVRECANILGVHHTTIYR